MPIDFNKPSIAGNYSTGVLQPLREAMAALSQWLDPAVAGTLTATPTGAYRLNAGAVERFNGTSWAGQSINGLNFAGGAPAFAAPLGVVSSTVDKLTMSGSGSGVGSLGVDTAGSLILKADEAGGVNNSAIVLRVDGAERGRVTATQATLPVAVRMGPSGAVDVVEDSARGRVLVWEGSARAKALVLLNGDGYGWVGMTSAEALRLGTNNVDRVILDASGNTYPNADGSQALGGASKAWSNVFAKKLQVNTALTDATVGVGGTVKVSGSAGGLVLGRRDNDASAWSLHSAAGELSVYEHVGGANRLQLSADGLLTLTGAGGGGGLVLPNASNTDATVLDWYEEGSFTPSLDFSGVSTGITYAHREGRFTRVGNLVTIWISVWLSNRGSGSGVAYLRGLPFAVSVAPSFGGTFFAIKSNYGTFSGLSGEPSVRVEHGSTVMALLHTTSAAANYQNSMTNTNFDNATGFVINGTYRVAS